MSTKPKSVDLGALQDDFIKAKAKHQSDIKAFINAEAALDRSRDAFGSAEAALRAAMKTVFMQG